VSGEPGRVPNAADPALQRWRLILGEPGAECGRLDGDGARQDAALSWLYGRDPELLTRGVRPGGVRAGSDGGTALTTVDWINDVHRLFPKETVERLERDALERYHIEDLVTDVAVLNRVVPNEALLRAVLRTKHLMKPDVLAAARRIVADVVGRLVAALSTEVQRAFTGSQARQRTTRGRVRDLDIHQTIRRNLRHYDLQRQQLLIERPWFLARQQRHLDRWQLILLVDQSASMVESVIHSAVTASCLWGLPGISTALVAFDTQVVDLTHDVTDPVELLMKVQLGGGTDIAAAVRYGIGLIRNPRRVVFVVISDLFEGGDATDLVAQLRDVVENGGTALALTALDRDAEPNYNRDVGQRLADVGVHVGAMTPDRLVEFVAGCLNR
jgi:Mg-chelatase subunit ChlD